MLDKCEKIRQEGVEFSVQTGRLDLSMNMDSLSMVTNRRTEYMEQSCVCVCVCGSGNLWSFLLIVQLFQRNGNQDN